MTGLKNTTLYDSSRYEWSHGKKPRGDGRWGFIFD